ncbi:unnamed protein product [Linum trigynum]|uniref:Cupin type-1 domain-containing protein n=1 Tax=Linum trigynum TaxID=586398 RepID=A0AAV2EBX5_9ROSI
MATKLLIPILLCFLAASASALSQQQSRPLEYQLQAQQCNMDRISSSQPTIRMQHEGGVTEVWDSQEDQFICAGIAPFRDVIEPQSLSVPKFFPAPRLVYIEQGRGVLGINFPGCPPTFHSGGQQQQQQYQRGPRRMMSGRGDEHQKIHRIQQGDIVAIPHGAATWSYNDGNQDLIYVTIVDLNNDLNQLDQNFRGFLLGGGRSDARQSQRELRGRGSQGSRRGWRGTEGQQWMSPNIFQGFDEELIAEAFNVQTETVRRMQNDNRGMIVRCQEEMRFVTEEEEQMQQMGWGRQGQRGSRFVNENDEKSLPAAADEEQEQENGIEEGFCNMKIKHNLERPVQADFFTREAGRINIANRDKLPILGFLDMSAERGSIMPRAMYTPHWSMTDHRAVYVLRGDLQVQISDDKGNQIMNNRVQEGEMFVIPQFFATMGMAGNQGCEYVTFKTSGRTMKHQMAGYSSVMRAMPIDVLSNSFQMSPREAEQLKCNRDPESMLFSPIRGSSSSRRYPTNPVA